MNITVYEGSIKHEVSFSEGETILKALQNAGIQSITAPCGGKGACKKCGVYVRGADFSGTVLSCLTPAEDGMKVEIIPEIRYAYADQVVGDVYPPTPGKSGYAVACDIGTTTVVCQLLDLVTGARLAGIAGSSSQRIFGGDVLSRLEAAKDGHAEELHAQIISQINYYIGELRREAEIPVGEIRMLAVTGNTISMHFFAGIDPSQISTAPFKPVSLFGEMLPGRDLGLDLDGNVFLCPAVSGFIGSDTLCGVLSNGMGDSEGEMLMMDLGTNTEIVMGSREHMTACAVDGGAVFKASLLEYGMTASEGAIAGVQYEDGKLVLSVLGDGEPKGICGSGFIDALGILFEEEILDEMGHIADPDETESGLAHLIGTEHGHPVFYLTEDRTVFLSQADISRFQLAKAAIWAGTRILAEEEGISLNDLERLFLGGGFGTFAHRRHAALLGVIPTECKGKTVKLGNAALTGAISAALSETAREDLLKIREKIRVIDLPSHPSFSDAYMDGMMFE